MEVVAPDPFLEAGQRALELGNLAQAREEFLAALQLLPDGAHERPLVHLQVAQVAYELGQTEEAKTHLAKVVELDPDQVEALEGLAKIDYEQGRLRRAVEWLERILQLKPNDVDTLLTLGMVHKDLGENAHALRYLHSVLDRQPDHPDALLLSAQILAAQGKHAEALVHFDGVLAQQPEVVDALVGAGWCALHLGDSSTARDRFEAAVQQLPRHREAWRGMGKLLTALRDWPAAIAAHRRRVELDAQDAEAHIDLAWALHEGEQPDASLAQVELTLKAFPDNPEVSGRLGLLCLRLRKLDQAEYLLQKAIVANPGDPEVHENLGYTYLMQRDFLPAVRAFKRAWNLKPLAWASLVNLVLAYSYWAFDMLRDGRFGFSWDFGGVTVGGRARSAKLLDLGHEAFHMGDYLQASMYYRKIKDKDPNYEVASCWHANALLKLGHLDDAIQVCQDGLARHPASAPLMALLGSLCLAQQKPQNAIRLLTKAVELAPEHGMAWITLGRAHQRAGEYPEALGAFQRAAELQAEDPYMFRHMGDAALAMGDRNLAIEAYANAIDRTPRDLVACQRLIECYFVGRQYEEALHACRHALSVDPRAYTAYAWMGRIYRQLHSYTAAKDAFQRAIALKPNLGYLHRQLAALHEQLKEFFDAVDAYEAALALDPDDVEAQRGLQRSKKATGKRR